MKQVQGGFKKLNYRTSQEAMEAYEQVQRGPLKLKGVAELGVTKRKKKKTKTRRNSWKRWERGGEAARTGQADTGPSGIREDAGEAANGKDPEESI